MAMKDRALVGKFLYGALFTVVLPLIFFFWASILDRSSIDWAVPKMPVLAMAGIFVGLFMVAKGMLDLAVLGHGLPMNAYPPQKLVTRGIYSLFSHPIYLGAIFLSTGIALWFQSSSGLYIITPLLILMILSLLFGYERLAMEKRFGNAMSQYTPLFSLPRSSESGATWLKKLAMLLLVFLPWLMVGYLVDEARCSQGCHGAFIGLTHPQQAQNWAGVLWIIPYVYVAGRMLVAHTGRSLRHVVIAGMLAAGLGIYLYIVLPGFGFQVMNNPWILALVNGGVLALAMNYRAIWSILQNYSERVANSRKDWLFAGGRFRIISHSLYSGLAGAVGVGIASFVIGNSLAVLLVTLCSVIGAATYAQVSWGSHTLLRPFGYWGAILGGIAGGFLADVFFHVSLSSLVLAGVLSAPFAQSIGRLRCLVQGCCHGSVTTEILGIRVWQSQSRVVAISDLCGKYIVNTQLYSIIFNVPLGILLISMWLSHSFYYTFIIGLYFILTGIERFTEDAYRGETQTRSLGRLRENQWIALAAVLTGIAATMLPSSSQADHISAFTPLFLAAALAGGLFTAFAMSMDFPKSTLRFSRLSG